MTQQLDYRPVPVHVRRLLDTVEDRDAQIARLTGENNPETLLRHLVFRGVLREQCAGCTCDKMHHEQTGWTRCWACNEYCAYVPAYVLTGRGREDAESAGVRNSTGEDASSGSPLSGYELELELELTENASALLQRAERASAPAPSDPAKTDAILCIGGPRSGEKIASSRVRLTDPGWSGHYRRVADAHGWSSWEWIAGVDRA
jgi:hypothetical protein